MAENPDIVLRIRAELDQAKAEIAGLKSQVQGLAASGEAAGGGLKQASDGTKEVGGAAKGAGGALELLTGFLKGVKAGAVGMISAATVGKLNAIAEAARQVREGFAGQVGAVADFEALYAGVGLVANEVGTSVQRTADALVQMRTAAAGVGATDAEVLSVVRAIEQLGQEAGKSEKDIDGVRAALTAALESGTLSGAKLKDLISDFPALGRAIEAGLGRAPGALREVGTQGLAAVSVFRALAKESDAIAAAAAQRTGEVGRSWQRVRNGVSEVVAAMDQATAATETYRTASTSVLDGLAERLSTAAALTRQAFDASALGVDPRLQGEDRFNALLQRRIDLQGQLATAQRAASAYDAAGPIERNLARLDPMAGARAADLAGQLATVERALRAIQDANVAAAKGVAALGTTGEQAARALAMVGFQGEAGLKRLQAAVGDVSASIKGMNDALRGPAPEPTVAGKLREMVALADQAGAAMSTGDLATAIPLVKQGAEAIRAYIAGGGAADNYIRGLAREFQAMGDQASKAAKSGKDAVDAAAKAQKVEMGIKPVLDEAAMAALLAQIKAASQTITVSIRTQILPGAGLPGGGPPAAAPDALEWEAAKGGDSAAGTGGE